MYILLVILRNAASSKSIGLLVAPITKILPLSDATPSNCTKNSVFTLRAASLSSLLLAVSIESISSIKIMLGLLIYATANKVLIIFSLSPTHFDIKVLADILKNVDLHSDATALASIVLPFPGGPYNKIPFVGSLIP
jgi:hypothetical protein